MKKKTQKLYLLENSNSKRQTISDQKQVFSQICSADPTTFYLGFSSLENKQVYECIRNIIVSEYIVGSGEQNFQKTKAELLQESIIFLIHLFARDVIVMKKLEIEKTKPTFIISVLKVEDQVVLISSISNFFTNKTSLANKWMSFSSSDLALTNNFHV